MSADLTRSDPSPLAPPLGAVVGHEASRRRFLGYLLAGPVLVAAARLAPARADGVPSPAQPSDVVDLNDILTGATVPTADLVSVVINPDGTASFDMPRCESGQGITTSTAMLIAEELDLPLDKVHVTLADARPELLFNQATYGSNTTISTYTPFRVAAAVARQALLEAAAIELGDNVADLQTRAGQVVSASGGVISYGDLSARAAVQQVTPKQVSLKDPADFTVIGTPRNRVDAFEAVTGRKKYAMDLDVVPDALPTMICRAPTIMGTPKSLDNRAQVLAMPGVTHVAVLPTGVAVRARTFGQCIDAVRAMKVSWNPGTVDTETDKSIREKLLAAEVPLAVPALPVGATTIEQVFTFSWKSNSALEPQTAVADVRKDGTAEIWTSSQTPILALQNIAKALGVAESGVKVHTVQGGGAFGRRMFPDAPVEAALASQAFGAPVKLMWHRTDEFRFGRTHPMCLSRVRATLLAGNVLSFEQRHTSVATDYTMALGEEFSQAGAQTPPAGLGNYLEYSQAVFNTTQNVPYDFGAVTQQLTEILEWDTFHTGSNRNLYSPDAGTAVELMVDQVAKALKQDPYRFRRSHLKDPRARAVLDAVAIRGKWGRSMPAGTAQGIAIHVEYKGATAALVEIDNRPQTVGRQIREAVTGPRVTKVVFAIDAGLAVNPRGLEAQMMGGIMDAIGQVLTESLHLVGGYFAEGSWDEYYYTRQWNSPPEIDVIVMPPTTGRPGGAGEAGVAAAKAATAAALARATGKLPTTFPVNHDDPLPFEPLPTVPSVPQSPTDGLSYTR